MKIGYRTIKTAIATPSAMWIAQLLGVTNFVSAGIITILCIQPSRKQSVLSAWHRFLACILASLFSFVFFETLGYHIIVVGLMLALFIPTTVWLKITPGIATSSVIILNLYSAGHIPLSFLGDQFLLISVGIGTALLFNLYMPSLDKHLIAKQKQLEHNFQIILQEIALFIRNENDTWDGKELKETEDLLQSSLDLVEIDKENHMLHHKHPYRDYFHMRTKQFSIMKRMLPLVSKLPKQDPVAAKIAYFFENLSKAVHPGNTAVLFLNDLQELKEQFNKEALPKSREAFETRANLFRLLLEIEEYLKIKSQFKKSDVVKTERTRKTGSI